MDYYSIQGSCLISILLPLNELIGSYMFYLKLKNKKTNKVNTIVIAIGVLVEILLIFRKVDPYICFIFIGGILVALVQRSFMYRDVKPKNKFTDSEKTLKYFRVIAGMALIICPFLPFFQNHILSSMCVEVKMICYLIYIIWGSEEVLLNIDLMKNIASLNKIG